MEPKYSLPLSQEPTHEEVNVPCLIKHLTVKKYV
jgi:hypothetical protein